jgi:hypothetical protein
MLTSPFRKEAKLLKEMEMTPCSIVFAAFEDFRIFRVSHNEPWQPLQSLQFSAAFRRRAAHNLPK